MALDKNWIDSTDTSIIQPALKFYNSPFRKRERFLSKYYYARILENGHHYPEAVEAFSDAEHCFCKQADSVYLIRIASAKARIYTYQFIDDKAEQALLDAVRYSEELKEIEDEQRMKLSLADYYEASRRFEAKDSLLSLMKEVLPELRLWKASSAADLVIRQPEDSTRFPDDWRLFCKIADNQPQLLDWTSKTKYLLFRGQYADALAYLDGISPIDLPLFRQIAFWNLRRDAERQLGNYQEAYYAHNQCSSLVEELSLQVFQNDLRSVEERYQNKLNQYNNRIRTIALSILALLLLGAFLLVLYRKREKQEMLSGLREEYDMLVQVRKSELTQNEIFSKRLENRLTALKPYLSGDFPDELSDSSELRRMTEDSKQMLRNIGFLYGLYHPKFIQSLEEKGLSELETGYCCLFLLGFSGKTIPNKLHRNTFYNTSSAIRKKVGLGPHDTNLSIWIQDLYQNTSN